jgi:hypothetical protein
VKFFARFTARRRTVASVSTVTLFSTAIVGLALTNPGLATTDVALNDSGVWVTRSQDNLVGRFNHEAEVLDGAVTAGTSSIDVLQQAGVVLVHDTAAGTISPVDVAGLELTGSAKLPAGAEVGLGAQTVAILDPASGSLWVLPVEGVGSFSSKTTQPVAKLAGGAVLAVGTDGTVHAAGGDKLVTVTTTERGGPDEVTKDTLDVASPNADGLAITAVGENAVVLDRPGKRLFLPNGKTADVAGAVDVALQQPGPDADSVVLADRDSLRSQPLDGSTAHHLGAKASGVPVAPVFRGGCAYGAWTSGTVARDCAGTKDDAVRSLGLTVAGAKLEYRVNRDVVVLNELTTGSIWLADKDFELFDDWSDVLPSQDDQKKPDATPEATKDPIKDRDKPNRPPIATDDELGVRPGRTTILKLLDNDTDPDGDVLVADVSKSKPGLGKLQSIYGGARPGSRTTRHPRRSRAGRAGPRLHHRRDVGGRRHRRARDVARSGGVRRDAAERATDVFAQGRARGHVRGDPRADRHRCARGRGSSAVAPRTGPRGRSRGGRRDRPEPGRAAAARRDGPPRGRLRAHLLGDAAAAGRRRGRAGLRARWHPRRTWPSLRASAVDGCSPRSCPAHPAVASSNPPSRCEPSSAGWRSP